MLIDGRDIDNGSVFQTDICIIGAGAAGISIAKELHGTSIDVCLVESGGLIAESDTQSLAGGENVGHPYFDLETTRLRMFGGTTGVWSGWCRPLDAIDFKQRDWIPHSGWPISLVEIEDYYKRAQQICQLGPYEYNPDNWNLSEAPRYDFSNSKLVNRLIQFSPPTRFGEEYRQLLSQSNNTRIFLNSNVLLINTNKEGNHTTDVAARSLNGNQFKIHAKYFIIAAGGIENARLLLLSNSVHKAGLGNSRDVVGRYFMNHFFVTTGGVILSEYKKNDNFYCKHISVIDDKKRKAKIMGYVNFTEQTQESQNMLNVSFNLLPSDISSVFLAEENDEQWYSGIGRVFGNIDELTKGAINRLHAKFEPSALERIYQLLNIAEQSPNPNSRVTLADTIDELGQRKVRLDWQLQEIDLLSIERGHKVLGAELARLGLGRVVNILEASEGWPAEYIGDWHHMGTTRMHENPLKGAVDADCKLHDVDNLFVAGSSVFPTSGYSNPTLTIVALSIRLADYLKKIIR